MEEDERKGGRKKGLGGKESRWYGTFGICKCQSWWERCLAPKEENSLLPSFVCIGTSIFYTTFESGVDSFIISFVP